MVTFLLLLFIGKFILGSKPTEGTEQDDILFKLKKMKEELAQLEASKENKTASINLLVWENWKKRGII